MFLDFVRRVAVLTPPGCVAVFLAAVVVSGVFIKRRGERV